LAQGYAKLAIYADHVRTIISVALIALTVTACGRSVTVQPLTIASQETRNACAALIADVPERISAGSQWRVEPDPTSTAAWGSPPVVLRCGDEVAPPQPTDQLLEVDGVQWLLTPLTQGDQYSTVQRSPGVLISVPSAFAPTAAVIAELTPSVSAATTAL
jgi:Protein of unknown function (DUF3515)